MNKNTRILTLLLVEVRHGQLCQITLEWAGVVRRGLGVDGDSAQVITYPLAAGVELVLTQRVQQRERILAPGQTHQDFITVPDQIELLDGLD